MYWCSIKMKTKTYSRKKGAFRVQKITVWQKKSLEKFKWYTLVCTIYFRFVFSNQKGFFYFQLKVVGGTAYDLKVLDISDTFLTINMVKNCRIAFIVPIIGVFIVRFERDSKVFKDSDQIMASRFTNVDSLAAIARVFI